MAEFAEKQNFRFNHTMYRIKDPKVSLPFYQAIFGMNLVHKMDSEAGKFTNYFLAFPPRGGQKDEGVFAREGILELCHNWGTENDPNFKHCSGNEPEHKGFGHICVIVDDIHATCEYLESKGVQFKKRLTDGQMKNIAFALDPDGYWIELLSVNYSG